MEDKKYIKLELNNVIFIIVLLLIILAILIYLSIDMRINDAKQDEVNNKVDINSSYVLNKISFSQQATSEIYKNGNFNSNNLILTLGYDKLDWSIFSITNNNGEYKLVIPASSIDKSINYIFGDKINYNHQNIVNDVSDLNILFNKGVNNIFYSNDTSSYTIDYIAGSSEENKFIYPILNDITKDANTIKISVNTAFINTVYNEDTSSFEYEIYKDYNFNNNTYNNKIDVISTNNLFDNYINNSNSLFKLDSNNENLNDKLNTYIYTLTLNNDEYYLTEFNIK